MDHTDITIIPCVRDLQSPGFWKVFGIVSLLKFALQIRDIWLGAATHDIGLDVRPGVVSHAIDSNLDDERAKVGADLLATGSVATEQLVTRPNPLSEGLTATGAPWKTDGSLLVIELKNQ